MFSIHQVEIFSQIKAGTIRIWEKRYNICKPARTDGKTRRYNLSELELLLNISLLNRNGFKISRLAELDLQTLKEKVAKLTDVEDLHQHAINLLILFKFSEDIEAFERHLNHCFQTYGNDETLKFIILPFLEKVDLLSYNSTANEVHLAVTILRKKIIYCIETVSPQQNRNKTALLFLAKGEHFDLILLYMTYILKSFGLNIIYLGTNIPEQNILAIMKQKLPDFIFTYLPPGSSFQMNNLLYYLQETSPNQKLNIIKGDRSFAEDENNLAINLIAYDQFGDFLNSGKIP